MADRPWSNWRTIGITAVTFLITTAIAWAVCAWLGYPKPGGNRWTLCAAFSSVVATTMRPGALHLRRRGPQATPQIPNPTAAHTYAEAATASQVRVRPTTGSATGPRHRPTKPGGRTRIRIRGESEFRGVPVGPPTPTISATVGAAA